MAFWIPSKTLPSTPSGLSYVFSRNGGTAAATNRETNQREITQLELRHELVQVLSESVVVVAGCWLAGLAEPSAVIGDDTATCGQKHRDTAAGGRIAKKILYSNRHRRQCGVPKPAGFRRDFRRIPGRVLRLCR